MAKSIGRPRTRQSMLRRLKRRVRSAIDPEYRREIVVQDELTRIRSFPRHTVLHSDIFGHPFTIVDGPSFYAQYVDIIGNGIYDFRPKSHAPLVIDGGANVGVSVLYFKKKFPKGRILAFEADSSVFSALEYNVRA